MTEELNIVLASLIPNQVDRNIFIDKILELISDNTVEIDREITREDVLNYLKDNGDTISIDISDYI